jgi:hypothetical protein
MNNGKWWIGLAASILVALAGQPDSVPDNWRHILGLLGIVGTAINGYMLQRPPKDDDTIVKGHR